MNSNPYALPAFILCMAALSGCGAWAWLSLGRQAATGRHARQRAASAEADQFVAELRGEPRVTMTVTADASQAQDRLRDIHGQLREMASSLLPDWWDEEPPQPPAVEILTGPPLAVRQPRPVPGVPRAGGGGDPGLLARMRDALLPDVWKPEPGEVTFTPADPDATRFDLQPVPDVVP